MVIGGYRLNDNGVYGITVNQYESGWSFFLDGDDAEYFRESWKAAKDCGSSFGEFLDDHEWSTLFH